MLLFETIQIFNGKLKNIELHQERLNNSYYYFYQKQCKYNLKELIYNNIIESIGKYKCRFCYDENNYSIEIIEYFPKKINSLKLVYCDLIEYEHKFTNRKSIENLLEKKENCDDIIIVKNGFISDSSYANLIFYDGKNYYTPKHSLLKGTMRKYLLENKMIYEAEIRPKDLEYYKFVKMINAMLDLEESKPIMNFANI